MVPVTVSLALYVSRSGMEIFGSVNPGIYAGVVFPRVQCEGSIIIIRSSSSPSTVRFDQRNNQIEDLQHFRGSTKIQCQLEAHKIPGWFSETFFLSKFPQTLRQPQATYPTARFTRSVDRQSKTTPFDSDHGLWNCH